MAINDKSTLSLYDFLASDITADNKTSAKALDSLYKSQPLPDRQPMSGNALNSVIRLIGSVNRANKASTNNNFTLPSFETLSAEYGWADKTPDEIKNDFKEFSNSAVNSFIGPNLSKSRKTPTENVAKYYEAELNKLLAERSKVVEETVTGGPGVGLSGAVSDFWGTAKNIWSDTKGLKNAVDILANAGYADKEDIQDLASIEQERKDTAASRSQRYLDFQEKLDQANANDSTLDTVTAYITSPVQASLAAIEGVAQFFGGKGLIAAAGKAATAAGTRGAVGQAVKKAGQAATKFNRSIWSAPTLSAGIVAGSTASGMVTDNMWEKDESGQIEVDASGFPILKSGVQLSAGQVGAIAGSAIASGAIVRGFDALTAKLGIRDIDRFLASRPAGFQAAFESRLLNGLAAGGVESLEEASDEAANIILVNLAEGKPWHTGLYTGPAAAGVLGGIGGGVFGALESRNTALEPTAQSEQAVLDENEVANQEPTTVVNTQPVIREGEFHNPFLVDNGGTAMEAMQTSPVASENEALGQQGVEVENTVVEDSGIAVPEIQSSQPLESGIPEVDPVTGQEIRTEEQAAIDMVGTGLDLSFSQRLSKQAGALADKSGRNVHIVRDLRTGTIRLVQDNEQALFQLMSDPEQEVLSFVAPFAAVANRELEEAYTRKEQAKEVSDRFRISAKKAEAIINEAQSNADGFGEPRAIVATQGGSVISDAPLVEETEDSPEEGEVPIGIIVQPSAVSIPNDNAGIKSMVRTGEIAEQERLAKEEGKQTPVVLEAWEAIEKPRVKVAPREGVLANPSIEDAIGKLTMLGMSPDQARDATIAAIRITQSEGTNGYPVRIGIKSNTENGIQRDILGDSNDLNADQYPIVFTPLVGNYALPTQAQFKEQLRASQNETAAAKENKPPRKSFTWEEAVNSAVNWLNSPTGGDLEQRITSEEVNAIADGKNYRFKTKEGAANNRSVSFRIYHNSATANKPDVWYGTNWHSGSQVEWNANKESIKRQKAAPIKGEKSGSLTKKLPERIEVKSQVTEEKPQAVKSTTQAEEAPVFAVPEIKGKMLASGIETGEKLSSIQIKELLLPLSDEEIASNSRINRITKTGRAAVLDSDAYTNFYKLGNGKYIVNRTGPWEPHIGIKDFWAIGDNLSGLIDYATSRIDRARSSKQAARVSKIDTAARQKFEEAFGDVFKYDISNAANSSSYYVTHIPSGIKIRISDHTLPGYYENTSSIDVSEVEDAVQQLREALTSINFPDTKKWPRAFTNLVSQLNSQLRFTSPDEKAKARVMGLPYLKAKRLPGTFGAALENPGFFAKVFKKVGLDSVIIPYGIVVNGKEFNTTTLQLITSDAQKFWMSGGTKKGSAAPVTTFQVQKPGTVVTIGEGWANAATIAFAAPTLNNIFSAGDKGNLLPAARMLAAQMSNDSTMAILADIDPDGGGVMAANSVKEALAEEYPDIKVIVLPPPNSGNKESFDWNDLLVEKGVVAVRHSFLKGINSQPAAEKQAISDFEKATIITESEVDDFLPTETERWENAKDSWIAEQEIREEILREQGAEEEANALAEEISLVENGTAIENEKQVVESLTSQLNEVSIAVLEQAVERVDNKLKSMSQSGNTYRLHMAKLKALFETQKRMGRYPGDLDWERFLTEFGVELKNNNDSFVTTFNSLSEGISIPDGLAEAYAKVLRYDEELLDITDSKYDKVNEKIDALLDSLDLSVQSQIKISTKDAKKLETEISKRIFSGDGAPALVNAIIKRGLTAEEANTFVTTLSENFEEPLTLDEAIKWLYVYNKKGRLFSVSDGAGITLAGAYNPDYDRIELFLDAIQTEEQLRTLLKHEMFHKVFAAVRGNQKYSAVNNKLNAFNFKLLEVAESENASSSLKKHLGSAYRSVSAYEAFIGEPLYDEVRRELLSEELSAYFFGGFKLATSEQILSGKANQSLAQQIFVELKRLYNTAVSAIRKAFASENAKFEEQLGEELVSLVSESLHIIGPRIADSERKPKGQPTAAMIADAPLGKILIDELAKLIGKRDATRLVTTGGVTFFSNADYDTNGINRFFSISDNNPQGAGPGREPHNVRGRAGKISSIEQAEYAARGEYSDRGAGRLIDQDKAMPWYSRLTAKVQESLVDHYAPIARHIARNGSKELGQNAIDALYAVRPKSGQFMNRLRQSGGEQLLDEIARIAEDNNLDAEQTLKTIGLWASARWAPSANAVLRNKIAHNGRKVIEKYQEEAMITEDALQKLEQRLQLKLALFDSAVHDPDIEKKKHIAALAGGMNLAQAKNIIAQMEKRIPKKDLVKASSFLYAMNTERLLVELENGGVLPEQVEFILGPNSSQLAIARTLQKAGMAFKKNGLSSLDELEQVRVKAREVLRSMYVPFYGEAVNNTISGVQNFAAINDGEVYGTLKGSKTYLTNDGITSSFGGASHTATNMALKDFKDALLIYADELSFDSDFSSTRAKEAGIWREDSEDFSKREAIFAGQTYDGLARWIIVPRQFLQILHGHTMSAKSAFWLRPFQAVTTSIGFLASHGYPLFAPINMVRDIQERVATIASRNINGVNSAQFAKDAMTKAMGQFIGIWKVGAQLGFRNKFVDSTIGRELQDFVENGGMSLFRDQFDLAMKTLSDEAKSRGFASLKGLRALNKALAGWNLGFETIAPLSSFSALKAQGVSSKEAAAIVLDAMNFGKTGTSVSILASLYPFARASFVGANTLLKTLFNSDGSLNSKGFILAGVMSMNYAILKAIFAELDKEDDNSIPPILGVHETTAAGGMLVPLGNGKYISIPVGYGLARVANIIGDNVVKLSYGLKDPSDVLVSIGATGMLGQMTPIADSPIEIEDAPLAWGINSFSPVWATPFIRAYADKNVYGQRIYLPKDRTLIQTAVAPEFNDAARDIQEATGWQMTGVALQDTMQSILPGLVSDIVNSQTTLPHRQALGQSTNIPIIGRVLKQRPANPWAGPVRKIYDQTSERISRDMPVDPLNQWLYEQYDERIAPLTKTVAKRRGLSREEQYEILAEVQAEKVAITTSLFNEYLRQKRQAP